MSITVANLIAQVGADISQYKLRMNEVEQIQKLAESRFAQAGANIDNLQRRSERAAAASANYAKMAAAVPIEALHDSLSASVKSLSLASSKLVAQRVELSTAMFDAQRVNMAELKRVEDQIIHKMQNVESPSQKLLRGDQVTQAAKNRILAEKSLSEAIREHAESQAKLNSIDDRIKNQSGLDILKGKLPVSTSEVNKITSAAALAKERLANAQETARFAAIEELSLKDRKREIDYEQSLFKEQLTNLKKSHTALENERNRAINEAKKQYGTDIANTEKYITQLEREIKIGNDKLIALEHKRATFTERSKSLGGMSGDFARSAESLVGVRDENKAFQDAHSARLAQDAQEHGVRALNAAFGEMIKVGAGVEVVLGAATYKGAEFNHMLKEQINNTSLNSEGIIKMTEAVKSMGLESGIPLEKLASGFKDIENYGFTASESIKIARAAMKAAVVTGADYAATANLVAGTIRAYKLSVDDAAIAANVFFTISKHTKGNMDELVHAIGPAVAANIRYKGSIADVGSIFAILTQTLNSQGRAATGVAMLYEKLAAPTKTVITHLQNLDKQIGNTGHEFEKLFSPAGVRKLGVTGIAIEIDKVANKLKSMGKIQEAQDIVSQLVPATRGGAQLGTYLQYIRDGIELSKTMKKEILDSTDIENRYTEMLKDNQVQMDRARNSVTLMTASISEALSPIVQKLTGYIVDLTNKWNSLGTESQAFYVKSALVVGAFLILGGTIGKVIVGITTMRSAMIGLIGLEATTWAIGVAGSLGIVAAAAVALFSVLEPVTKKLGEMIEKLPKALRPNTGLAEFNVNANGSPVSQVQKDIFKVQQLQAIIDKAHPRKTFGEWLLGDIKSVSTELDSLTKKVYTVGDATDKHIQGLKTKKQDLLNLAKKMNVVLPLEYGGGGNFLGDNPGRGMNDAQQSFLRALNDREKKQKEHHDRMLAQANSFVEQLRKDYESLVEDSSLQGKFNRMVQTNPKFDAHHQEVAQGIIDEINNTTRLNSLNDDSVKTFDKLSRMTVEGIRNLGEWKELQKEINDLRQRGLSSVVTEYGLNQSNLHIKELEDDLAEKTANHIQKLINQAKHGDPERTVFQDWFDKLNADEKLKNVDVWTKIAIARQAQLTDIAKKSAAEIKKADEEATKVTNAYADEVLRLRTEYELLLQEASGKKIPKEVWKDTLSVDAKRIFDQLNPAQKEELHNAIERNKALIESNQLTQFKKKLELDLLDIDKKRQDSALKRTRPDLAYSEEFLRQTKEKNRELFDTLGKNPDQLKEYEDRIRKAGMTDWFNEEIEKSRELTQGYYDLGGGIKFTAETWAAMSKNMRDAFLKMAKQSEILTEMRDLASGIGDVFANMLNDLRDHGFKNFFSDIVNEFDKMLFQLAAKWLQSQIVQLLMNVITSSFGGAGGGYSSEQHFTGTDSLGGMIPGRATGGPVQAGRRYIINEGQNRGESFVPTKNGRMVTATEKGSNNDQRPIIFNMTVVTQDANSFRLSKSAIQSDLMKMASMAASRNG